MQVITAGGAAVGGNRKQRKKRNKKKKNGIGIPVDVADSPINGSNNYVDNVKNGSNGNNDDDDSLHDFLKPQKSLIQTLEMEHNGTAQVVEEGGDGTNDDDHNEGRSLLASETSPASLGNNNNKNNSSNNMNSSKNSLNMSGRSDGQLDSTMRSVNAVDPVKIEDLYQEPAQGSKSSDLFWLFFCFLGIMASFVCYGLLLEFTTSGGRKLHELSFLFVTSGLYTITAAAGRYVRAETPTTIPPARFAILGLTSMGSTFCSVRSLRYVFFLLLLLLYRLILYAFVPFFSFFHHSHVKKIVLFF